MTKQKRIMRLLDRGLSVKQVAKRIGVTSDYIYTTRWLAKNKRAKNKGSSKQNEGRKPIFKSQRSKDVQKIFKAAGITQWDKSVQPDVVNHPPHYTVGGIETLDFIEAKDFNFRLGNVVKYVTRAGRKIDSDPIKDLEKAAFYLNREIEARKSA